MGPEVFLPCGEKNFRVPEIFEIWRNFFYEEAKSTESLSCPEALRLLVRSIPGKGLPESV